MMGRTHALSGTVAYVAVAPVLHHATPLQLGVGMVTTAGAALLPDFDTKASTASRTLGPVTWLISWVVRAVTGHREDTHTFLAAALMAAAAAIATVNTYAAAGVLWLLGSLAVRAFRRHDPILERLIVAAVMAAGAWWLTISHNLDPWFLPVSAGLGFLAHLVGDMGTEQGLRPFRPFSKAKVRWAWIDTDKWVEHWIVVPALWLGLAVLLWRAAGPDLIHAISPITLTGGTP